MFSFPANMFPVNGVEAADIPAGTALDTFFIADSFYIHETMADALSAVGTFILIDGYAENGYFGKKRINGAQRAEKAAKTAVNKAGTSYNKDEDQNLP